LKSVPFILRAFLSLPVFKIFENLENFEIKKGKKALLIIIIEI